MQYLDAVSKMTDLSLFPRQALFNITVIRVCVPTNDVKEAEVDHFYEDLQDLLELTPKQTNKKILYIIGDWNAKIGSQEIPGITGKFGLRVQTEAVQRLIEFCQDNALVIANTLSNNPRDDSTHGHHQMINTEINLIMFFLHLKMELYTVNNNKTWS